MERKIWVAIFLTAAIFGFVISDDDSDEYSSESSEEVYQPRNNRRRGPRLCEIDTDCDSDRCCLPTIYGNICIEKGDDVGEACGGRYNCLSCKGPWLQCVAHPELGTVVDRERVSGRCQRRYVTEQPRETHPRETIPSETYPRETYPREPLPQTTESFDDVFISNSVV